MELQLHEHWNGKINLAKQAVNLSNAEHEELQNNAEKFKEDLRNALTKEEQLVAELSALHQQRQGEQLEQTNRLQQLSEDKKVIAANALKKNADLKNEYATEIAQWKQEQEEFNQLVDVHDKDKLFFHKYSQLKEAQIAIATAAKNYQDCRNATDADMKQIIVHEIRHECSTLIAEAADHAMQILEDKELTEAEFEESIGSMSHVDNNLLASPHHEEEVQETQEPLSQDVEKVLKTLYPYDKPDIVVKVVEYLKRGSNIRKYTRTGQSHMRFFFLSNDLELLCWKTPEVDDERFEIDAASSSSTLTLMIITCSFLVPYFSNQIGVLSKEENCKTTRK